ncbi:hypothetical protein SEA_ZARBODNAMRA_60 [Gordonia phage Zarbodnamra]|nr:hypothetical protein SEA_LYSIDIOUS_63 [Gordonia phage Lysidious]AXH67486.1 hypothetical protein SEA_ZARBODNAMRA_60 [Gordonia phage Zarbodnamra]QDB74563.1 hypothetical protein SEA_MELBA_59 [Gordonia phage Melba]QKO02378.1 hypothetical protein SEA_BLINGBLING_57 [Gordonia phage BlingBling]
MSSEQHVADAKTALADAKAAGAGAAAGYHLVVAQTYAILALVDALSNVSLPNSNYTIHHRPEGTPNHGPRF